MTNDPEQANRTNEEVQSMKIKEVRCVAMMTAVATVTVFGIKSMAEKIC